MIKLKQLFTLWNTDRRYWEIKTCRLTSQTAAMTTNTTPIVFPINWWFWNRSHYFLLTCLDLLRHLFFAGALRVISNSCSSCDLRITVSMCACSKGNKCSETSTRGEFFFLIGNLEAASGFFLDLPSKTGAFHFLLQKRHKRKNCLPTLTLGLQLNNSQVF